MTIGVRAGGEGCIPLPQLRKLFFGQNALDSGNDTWEKTLENNAVGVISKSRK